jgi:membrane protein YqaA with SNARE-associated domain
MSILPLTIGTIVGELGDHLYLLATKLGSALILLGAVTDSSFLTIPEGNDLLIVVLSAGKPWSRMLFYVLLTIVGSVLGCYLLYSVGRRGGNPLLKRRFSESAIQRTERVYSKFGALSVFIPSILPPPCPFKIFVLSAGVFRLGKLKFITAVTIGRSIRYLTWGIVAVLYGEPVKVYMTQNARKIGVLFFVAFILVLTMLVVAYVRRSPGRGDRA